MTIRHIHRQQARVLVHLDMGGRLGLSIQQHRAVESERAERRRSPLHLEKRCHRDAAPCHTEHHMGIPLAVKGIQTDVIPHPRLGETDRHVLGPALQGIDDRSCLSVRKMMVPNLGQNPLQDVRTEVVCWCAHRRSFTLSTA